MQAPLQHSLGEVQLAPSAVQATAAEQTPRVVSHCRLQQSVGTAQEVPVPPQVATDDAHLPAATSHDREQHCPSAVHAPPATVHTTLVFPAPDAPPEPEPPEPVPLDPPLWLAPEEPPHAGPSKETAAKTASTRNPLDAITVFMVVTSLFGCPDKQLEFARIRSATVQSGTPAAKGGRGPVVGLQHVACNVG